ncbi:hypothetical protein [Laribacter hongkongensis]|uniref:hypothetical protein n=1 Tax=Laribacter hongkongensis TaxID=168471 RepID=UPI001EFE9FFE|nr:hypothetical protein [Laribacter hongkongensis]MCG9078966.1 hypothetical protein [Laribacter hongkongensis]
MSDSIKLIVSASQVQKLVITGHPSIDAVSVYLEDQGKRFSETSYAGKLTLTVDSRAYTYFWSHMGSPLSQFLQSADTCYLRGKLMQCTEQEELDGSALESVLRNEIIRQRRALKINADRARELYDYSDRFDDPHSDIKFMNEVLGDEWYLCLPKRPTIQASAITLAIDAMKQAFQEPGHDPA